MVSYIRMFELRSRLLLLVVLSLLFACTPKEEAGADGVETTSEEIGKGSNEKKLTLNPVNLPDPEDNQVAPPPPAVSLPIGTREKITFSALSEPLLPEDKKIGPIGGGGEYATISMLIVDLFESVAKGATQEDLLHPEQREYLMRVLLDFPEGDISCRVGKVNPVEAGRVSVNCRIFRPLEGSLTASSSGEVHMEAFQGLWRVVSLDLDFAELNRPSSNSDDPIEPLTYRWLELY